MSRTGPRTKYKGVSDLELKAFARRLHEEMVKKGWNQSTLAKEAFGTEVKEGRRVPKGRDRISVYIAGKNLPDDANMKRLAKALGVPVSSLAPDFDKAPVDRQIQDVQLGQDPDGSYRVRVDLALPNFDLASALITCIREVKAKAEAFAVASKSASEGLVNGNKDNSHDASARAL